MGPFVVNVDLCLREFSKSLIDCAYTWYSTLLLSTIAIWDDMVENFCIKYFHGRKKLLYVLSTTPSKSPLMDSLTSSDDLEILLLFVMGSRRTRACGNLH